MFRIITTYSIIDLSYLLTRNGNGNKRHEAGAAGALYGSSRNQLRHASAQPTAVFYSVLRSQYLNSFFSPESASYGKK
jgi:hypothetical protein